MAVAKNGYRDYIIYTIELVYYGLSTYRGHKKHGNAHSPAVTVGNRRSNLAPTNDTPYFALTHTHTHNHTHTHTYIYMYIYENEIDIYKEREGGEKAWKCIL